MAAKKTTTTKKTGTKPKGAVFDETAIFAEGVNPRVPWAMQTLLEELKQAFPDVKARHEGHNMYRVTVDLALNVPQDHPAEAVVALLPEDNRISDVERTDEITMKVHFKDIMALYDRREPFGIIGALDILGGGE